LPELNKDDPEVQSALEALLQEQYAGLVTKRDELLAENSKQKGKLKELEDRLAEIERAEAEKRAAEETSKVAKVEQSGDVEALKELHKQALEAKDNLIKERDERIKELNANLHRYIGDTRLTEAITAEGGVPEILLPHLRGRVKVDAQGEDFAVQVLGTDGKPLLNKSGDPASIRDLVAEFKANDVFSRVFASDVKAGSGSRSVPGGGNGTAKNPWKKETWNLTEQMIMKADAPEMANAMMAQAGIT